MTFQIIRNDITRVTADAIVNSANPDPVIGGGTDGAIYEAAGREQLLAARKKIGVIKPSEAKATPAFAMHAKYIIHTAGPVWIDGKHGEKDILRACYRNCLSLASRLECSSIAFPLIATGTYGFPKDLALSTALEEFEAFTADHDMQILMVVFDEKSFAISKTLVDEIDEYIDSHTAKVLRRVQYRGRSNLPKNSPVSVQSSIAYGILEEGSLEETVSHAGMTFQQKLFELIDESGMSDVEVYKKANIDRKVFSKIRSHVDYQPSRRTAIAFAIALELDQGQMEDLLSRAGYAMSPGSKSDLIISYFVEHHNYDIFQINAALFQYGQPLLG